MAWNTLRLFAERHPQAESALRAWYTLVERAAWTTPADVRKTFNTADFIGTRIVFDIKGNHFRIVAQVDYERSLLFIIWVGRHAEHDRTDVRTVRYEPSRESRSP